MTTYSAATVIAWYDAIDNRPAGTSPSAANLASYVAELNSGVATPAEIQASIEANGFSQNYLDVAIREYQVAFGEVPPQSKLQNWATEFKSNPSAITGFQRQLANSGLFLSTYGVTASSVADGALVGVMFKNTYGYDADPTTLATLEAKNMTAAQLIKYFANDPAFITATQPYITAFQNAEVAGTEPTTGSLYTVPGVVSSTVNLTVNIDNVKGTNFLGTLNNYSVSGQISTLNPGDMVTGIGANNTLTIVDAYYNGSTSENPVGDSIPAGVTLNNIQNIILNTANNAGSGNSIPFDTSSFTSVTSTVVTSSGIHTDVVKAGLGSTVAVTHDGTDGGVTVEGGTGVTVTTYSNDSSDAVVIGNAYYPGEISEGNISVTAYGIEGGVEVEGGANVTVNVALATSEGDIDIGYPYNSATQLANPNPTGQIVVTSNSTEGADNSDTIYGGSSVTVSVKGDAVDVGDDTGTVQDEPAGAVTITEALGVAYNDLATGNTTKGGNVSVFGGTTVNVTSNDGGLVTVGAVGVAGTSPTGAVTILDTSSGLAGAFGLDGGTGGADVFATGAIMVTEGGGQVTIGYSDSAATLSTGTIQVTETVASHADVVINGGNGVTVNAQGQYVEIGYYAGTAGAQIVNQASQYTGYAMGSSNSASAVYVDGGSTVTVNTTGGDVGVGAYNGATLYAPTGAVVINNTFSGAGEANGYCAHGEITVLGGSTVAITVANSTNANIDVGTYTTSLTSTGALADLASDSTGNVTINNIVTNGSVTTAGDSSVYVTTNGATIVTISGAGSAEISDAQTLAAMAHATSGVVASTLTSVVLNYVDDVTINSDVLNALSISNDTASGFTVDSSTGATVVASLALTLGSDSGAHVTDNNAAAIVVSTSGSAANTVSLTDTALTSLTFSNAAALTVDDSDVGATPTTAVAITANGTGALNLGDTAAWTGGVVTSITTSDAAGVSVTLNADVASFNGGASGNNVVTAEALTPVPGNVLNGGTGGNNTLIVTDVQANYQGVLGGTIFQNTSNFQTLGLGAQDSQYATGSYDVSGFTAVQVGAGTGDLTLINAAAAETLAFTGDQLVDDTTTWIDQAAATSGAALSVTVGTATTAGLVADLTVESGATATVGVPTVNVTSSGEDGVSWNELNLTDGGGMTTINVAGSQPIEISYTAGLGTSTLTTINASASSGGVYVSGVEFDTTTGAAISITGGKGLLTVDLNSSMNNAGVTHTVTTGSGGGDITVGAGGAGSAFAVGGAINTEVINLGASIAVRDTLSLDALTPVLVTFTNTGIRAVANNFTNYGSTNIANGDVLNYDQSVTFTASTAATADGAAGTTDTFSVSNGVFTLLTAATPTTYTAGELELQDVQTFVDAGAVGAVGAFAIGGSTYVIEKLATGGVDDNIIQLNGVTGITGFSLASIDGVSSSTGTTIALSGTSVALPAASNGGSAIGAIYSDSSVSIDTLTTGTAADPATSTAASINTYHFGNFGELEVGAGALGNVVITTSGVGSEAVIAGSASGGALGVVSYNGNLVLDTTGGSFSIGTLTDTGSDAKIYVTSGEQNQSLTISNLAAPSVTTIDASLMAGHLTLGGTTLGTSALSNAGLTVLLGSAGTTAYLSGAADVVSEVTSTVADTIVANGAGDHITLSNGENTVTANGAGDTITVGTGGGTLTATGNADVINLGAASSTTETVYANGTADQITVSTTSSVSEAITIEGNSSSGGIGAGSTVSFGHGSSSETVYITGDVGSSSSSFTLFKNVTSDGEDHIVFSNATTEGFGGPGPNVNPFGAIFSGGAVNVAGAATLTAALNLAAATDAASNAGGAIAAHSGIIDWFQFKGNTYLVEAINSTATAAAHSTLAASDAVVEIVGLVDLNHSTFSGHTLSLA